MDGWMDGRSVDKGGGGAGERTARPPQCKLIKYRQHLGKMYI